MSHVAPKSQLFAVFAALMVFTVATVLVSRVDLGNLNLPVAMAVAVTKALLVILIFMEVKFSPKLVQVTAAAGFLFLGILILLHDDRLPEPQRARRRRAVGASVPPPFVLGRSRAPRVERPDVSNPSKALLPCPIPSHPPRSRRRSRGSRCRPA